MNLTNKINPRVLLENDYPRKYSPCIKSDRELYICQFSQQTAKSITPPPSLFNLYAININYYQLIYRENYTVPRVPKTNSAGKHPEPDWSRGPQAQGKVNFFTSGKSNCNFFTSGKSNCLLFYRFQLELKILKKKQFF